MNKLFFDCDSFCIVYMDDLLVFSESEEEHLKHLEIIFEKFRNTDLTQQMPVLEERNRVFGKPDVTGRH